MGQFNQPLQRWLHYRGRLQYFSGTREAGCFKEVATLHSDHYRQVPLYTVCALIFVVVGGGLMFAFFVD